MQDLDSGTYFLWACTVHRPVEGLHFERHNEAIAIADKAIVEIWKEPKLVAWLL